LQRVTSSPAPIAAIPKVHQESLPILDAIAETDDVAVSLTAKTQALGTDEGISTKQIYQILKNKKLTLSERRIQEIAKAGNVPLEWGYRAAKVNNQWRWFPL